MRLILLGLAAIACAHHSAQAQTTLFSDNFDTDTSASWSSFDGYQSVPDSKVIFAFDYSTNRVTINGTTVTIPPAPNGGGKGLYVAVNKNDETAEIAAVSLYPTGKSFSGDYALRFDMWMNYNGPAYGGTGSTEFSTFGINHVGDKVNWSDANAGGVGNVTSASDGVWFAVTGEGGAADDYRSFVGDGFSTAIRSTDSIGGFLDRDNDGAYEEEVSTEPDTYPLKQIFYSPTFESAGVPGKRWVQVEVRQRTNDVGQAIVTWLIDGYVMAQHSNGSALGLTSGNIMLGVMDVFSSIANPRADNYVIFDNVRVVNLNGVPELPIVSVEALDATATEAPGDTGSVTITRYGSTAAPLTVNYRSAGSATSGQDYTALPGALVFAAGQASTNLVITPINDARGESTETAYIVPLGGTAYNVTTNISAKVEIADDNDTPSAMITTLRPAAYEGNTNLTGQLRVEFSSTFVNPVTVNFTLSGDAASGTHFAPVGTSVLIPAGETNALINIVALNNTDSVSNRTVTVTLAAGANYSLGTSNTAASVTIFNDDVPAAVSTLFTDNFDTDTSANWSVNMGHSHNRATFAWDYSQAGIPPAPNSAGTTLGLKLEANVPELGTALFTGLSASPLDKDFSGDFRLRFDWWANAPGPMPDGGTGSTQLSTYGITRGGTFPQWPGGASSSDALYFAWSGEGGASQDIRVYTNAGARMPVSAGMLVAGTNAAAEDAAHPYYAVFGRLAPPEAQAGMYPSQTGLTARGTPAFAWHDVIIEKIGTTVTWTVDGVRMATVDVPNLVLSTNIFLGQTDINAGQAGIPEMLFGLYDNVRVEKLAAAAVPVTISGITVTGGSATITFTGSGTDTPATFKVAQSATVTGTYSVNAAAVITSLGGGRFQAVVPTSGDSMFYRIQR